MNAKHMVKKALVSSKRNSEQMLAAVQANQGFDFPEWWVSKLAVASAYLECLAECFYNIQEEGRTYSGGEEYPENYMTMSNLMTAARSSSAMLDGVEQMPDNADFPEWWKAKLYIASHMLASLNNAAKNVTQML